MVGNSDFGFRFLGGAEFGIPLPISEFRKFQNFCTYYPDDSDEENERIMEARQLEGEYLRNKAAMEQRHRNIEMRKLKRRGIADENESDFDYAEIDADLSSDVKRRKTPYRLIFY